jgi:hypothetical protein
MRKEPEGQPDTLYYLFSDHLGSTSVGYRLNAGQTITQRYCSCGGLNYTLQQTEPCTLGLASCLHLHN